MKAEKVEKYTLHRGTIIDALVSSSETMQAKRQWNDIFKMLKVLLLKKDSLDFYIR